MMRRLEYKSPDPFQKLSTMMERRGALRKFHSHATSLLARAYRKAFGNAMFSLGDRVLDLTPFLFGSLINHRLSLEDARPNEVCIVTPSHNAKQLIERFAGSAPYARDVQLRVEQIDKLLAFIQLREVYAHFDTAIVADLLFLLDDQQRHDFLSFLYDALTTQGKLVLLDLFTANGNTAKVGPMTFAPSQFIQRNSRVYKELARMSHRTSFASLHHDIDTSGLFTKSIPHGSSSPRFGSVTLGDEYQVLYTVYSRVEAPVLPSVSRG
ncbi:MAG TPA: hypothetical protein VI912_02890 [Candidatus Bilamarchaeaceae archaeon]|nr:hypothetical protein [Candidatus Bilamarchaeaceae archaeon]